MKTCEKCGGSIAEIQGEGYEGKPHCSCTPCQMQRFPRFKIGDGRDVKVPGARIRVCYGETDDGVKAVSLETVHENGNENKLMFSINAVNAIMTMFGWAVLESHKE